MPEWTEVLKLLGFATPLVYAGASYRFFHWLDEKASAQAKEAISSWLQPKERDRAAVAAAVLEIFDRVYTRPLLAWRAFYRSAIITMVGAVIMLFAFGRSNVDLMHLETHVMMFCLAVVNVSISYAALFIISRVLGSHSIGVVKALLLGPAIGIAMIVFVGNVIGFFLGSLAGPVLQMLHYERSVNMSFGAMIIGSAWFVHLWLPFFALCVGLLKALNYILLTVNKVQWFLERGKDHPFDALGFVAAPSVFLGAVAIQMLVSK